MKITDISEQKNKGRLNIYVDGDFYAGISEEAAGRLGLYIGKVVSHNELTGLSASDEYYKALSKSFDYLSNRKHSVFELKTKLKKYFSNAVINEVIARLIELNYLNDTDFANAYVKYKQVSSGKYKIECELKKKGVSKEIIQTALFALDDAENLEAMLRLLKKKDKLELDISKRRERVTRYLLSKGFEYSAVRKVLSENIKE